MATGLKNNSGPLAVKNAHNFSMMASTNKIFLSLITGLAILLVDSINLHAQHQPLLISEAIKTGLQNYQTIKAKQHFVQSSQAMVKNTRNEYLPNVIAAMQQNYGTVNGQYGPLSALGALGASSSGPAYSSQSWNSAFGSAYILGTNWEVFSFGRLTAKIVLSEAQVKKDSADLAQEEFIQSAKISGTYLDLLIARKLIENANSNLNRTQFVQQVVLARTKSGLNAGVDSSIANAEVSSAKLSLISAENNEMLIRNRLLQLLNMDPLSKFDLDSIYFKNIPANYTTSFELTRNPQVVYYQSRIEQSDKTKSYLKKSILPGVNIFGVFQSRGSGFENDYTPAYTDRYSKNYFEGMKPARSNYVTGFSLAWNILSIKKVKEQANAQDFLTKAYQQEYDLISTQLKDQLVFADERIATAIRAYHEVPVQYKAASDAYIQKSVLYKNGLANIIDVQQALFAVNKAETDMSVAYIQVWQALLLKAAASGDFDLFLGQVR